MEETIINRASPHTVAKRVLDSKGRFISLYLQLPNGKSHSLSPVIPPTLYSSLAPGSLQRRLTQQISSTSEILFASCSILYAHPSRNGILKPPTSSQILLFCLSSQCT